MKRVTPDVPTSLRIHFMIHFLIDVIFAVPLFFFPARFLDFVGWPYPADPVAARLVAAALFGIGIESLICSRRTHDSFVTMLNLKIVWSFSAVCGFFISIAELSWKAPPFLWVVLGIFVGFNVLWAYWRIRLW